MTAREKMLPANPHPCADCPWRVSNRGRRNKHGFYTKINLRRLWTGLREGERMTCHPTDPDMAEFEGYEETAVRQRTHECAGALTLVQRELAIFAHCVKQAEAVGAKDGLKRYRKLRPRGLTRNGIAAHVAAAIRYPGTLEARVMDLRANLDIEHEPLGPWNPEPYKEGLRVG